MASLYKRNKSPFWWLKWHDPTTGTVRRVSTECRIGDGRALAKAIQIRNEHSVKESRSASTINSNPFAGWVTEYLEASHSNAPRTLQRYKSSWRLVTDYLNDKKIVSPVQIDRATCLGYVAWRKGKPHLNNRGKGGKLVGMNTILLELKVLSKILNEAMVRGFIPFNPCVKLKLKKDPSRIKDEISDEQLAVIRAEIQRRLQDAVTPEEKATADFFDVSFEIARRQGIRLSETYMHLDCVDLNRGLLLVMGKGKKLEAVNLNPNLVPLFEKLKADGRTHTYTPPHNPALKWFKFFKSLRATHPDFKNISYHSTRVTVITRMERAGVPENVMMKTVLHSSTTVHRGYRRVKAAELAPYWSSLDEKSPAAAACPSGSPASVGSQDSQPAMPTKIPPSS
jgi:site-specific recombinase XerD